MALSMDTKNGKSGRIRTPDLMEPPGYPSSEFLIKPCGATEITIAA
jgi:hypothetical protein